MRRTWPFLVVFFVAGMPALVYQVVWQRALSLYFGVDIYSTTITVATFMLGLGLGSLLGGHIADRVRRPALYYAACEALLGVFGALSLASFRLVGESLGGSALGVVAPVTFALLLLPTTLMGMTLPLMCQSLRVNDAAIGEHFSKLYAVNTLGAAVGALVSAYLLIGYLGLDGAVLVAAAANFVLSIVALVVLQRPQDRAAAAVPPHEAGGVVDRSAATMRLVVACSFLSGLVALGYQLVWYRLLTVLLHGTVYVFGTILFVFLTGIALGSWYARRHADRGDALHRFGLAQLGIAAYALVFSLVLGYLTFLPGLRHLLAATALTTFHPAPELFSGIVSARSIYSLLDIGFWTVLFVGVPTFLMGYGFPQLMRAGTAAVSHLGRSIGRIYLANIVGSTVGSLLVGFVLLHFLGTEWTLALLVMAGCLTGVLAVVRVERPRTAPRWRPDARAAGIALAVITPLVFPGTHALLRAAHYADFEQVDFVAAEQRSGVVALRTQHAVISFEEERQILGTQRLLIDGSAHGGFQSASDDVVLDSAVRLALSAHPAPARILSIGLGDGRMCAAAVVDDDVEALLVVELNGGLRDVLAGTPQGRALFASDKLELVVDDGRRWLLANPDERFDVILMWPLHAAHASSGNLYSMEFFELVKAHLDDGGLLFARSVDSYSTARTIASSFENVVRIDDLTYVASEKRFRFRPALAGLTDAEAIERLEADRDTILRETEGSALNWDFQPNSEYYFTYPHARALQTWGGTGQRYRALDAGWAQSFIEGR
jgi:predicted membrane-bound spermidine synthase